MVAIGVAAALLAGCSSGDDDTSKSATSADQAAMTTTLVPACDEVYADGTTTDPELFDQSCRRADGELYVYGTAVTECTDARQLAHNDAGWGYVGEPWHIHAEGAERVAPAAEREICEAEG